MKRPFTLLILVALTPPILTSCGPPAPEGAPVDAGQGASRGSDAEVERGPYRPASPFVADDSLVGLEKANSQTLARPAVGALAGWLSPVAIPDAAQRRIVYNTWTDHVVVDPEQSFSQQGIEPGDPLGTPSLRVVDLETGSDAVIEDGASSAAWHADGRLAYMKGLVPEYRANEPYVGDVVVRDSLEGPPAVWSSQPDKYIVVGWAGSTLLAYRQKDGEFFDVLAIDGPGQVRTLATDALVVSVSPEGDRVLLEYHGSYPREASVMSVSTGQEGPRLNLETTIDPATGKPLVYLGNGGDWRDDAIVTESGAGIALFQVEGDQLRLADVLSLPAENFPMPIHEPRFVGEGAARVSAWAPIPGRGRAADRVYIHIDCELDANRCRQGDPFRSRAFFAVHNPSRPL